MKKILIVAAITYLIAAAFAALTSITERGFDSISIGLTFLILSAVCFFVALLLIFITKTEQVGKGILLAIGLMLITGAGFCSGI